jgi:hypothetical protein
VQRILVIPFVTVALATAALSQTNSPRGTPDKSKQELIALSREFVDTSIGKEIVVVDSGVTLTPSGPAGRAEVKGEWESVDLEDVEASIYGDEAVVTGRVVFRGRSPEGKVINNSSSVRIVYVRKKGGWKFVNGCLGICRAE